MTTYAQLLQNVEASKKINNFIQDELYREELELGEYTLSSLMHIPQLFPLFHQVLKDPGPLGEPGFNLPSIAPEQIADSKEVFYTLIEHIIPNMQAHVTIELETLNKDLSKMEIARLSDQLIGQLMNSSLFQEHLAKINPLDSNDILSLQQTLIKALDPVLIEIPMLTREQMGYSKYLGLSEYALYQVQTRIRSNQKELDLSDLKQVHSMISHCLTKFQVTQNFSSLDKIEEYFAQKESQIESLQSQIQRNLERIDSLNQDRTDPKRKKRVAFLKKRNKAIKKKIKSIKKETNDAFQGRQQRVRLMPYMPYIEMTPAQAQYFHAQHKAHNIFEDQTLSPEQKLLKYSELLDDLSQGPMVQEIIKKTHKVQDNPSGVQTQLSKRLTEAENKLADYTQKNDQLEKALKNETHPRLAEGLRKDHEINQKKMKIEALSIQKLHQGLDILSNQNPVIGLDVDLRDLSHALQYERLKLQKQPIVQTLSDTLDAAFTFGGSEVEIEVGAHVGGGIADMAEIKGGGELKLHASQEDDAEILVYKQGGIFAGGVMGLASALEGKVYGALGRKTGKIFENPSEIIHYYQQEANHYMQPVYRILSKFDPRFKSSSMLERKLKPVEGQLGARLYQQGLLSEDRQFKLNKRKLIKPDKFVSYGLEAKVEIESGLPGPLGLKAKAGVDVKASMSEKKRIKNMASFIQQRPDQLSGKPGTVIGEHEASIRIDGMNLNDLNVRLQNIHDRVQQLQSTSPPLERWEKDTLEGLKTMHSAIMDQMLRLNLEFQKYSYLVNLYDRRHINGLDKNGQIKEIRNEIKQIEKNQLKKGLKGWVSKARAKKNKWMPNKPSGDFRRIEMTRKCLLTHMKLEESLKAVEQCPLLQQDHQFMAVQKETSKAFKAIESRYLNPSMHVGPRDLNKALGVKTKLKGKEISLSAGVEIAGSPMGVTLAYTRGGMHTQEEGPEIHLKIPVGAFHSAKMINKGIRAAIEQIIQAITKLQEKNKLSKQRADRLIKFLEGVKPEHIKELNQTFDQLLSPVEEIPKVGKGIKGLLLSPGADVVESGLATGAGLVGGQAVVELKFKKPKGPKFAGERPGWALQYVRKKVGVELEISKSFDTGYFVTAGGKGAVSAHLAVEEWPGNNTLCYISQLFETHYDKKEKANNPAWSRYKSINEQAFHEMFENLAQGPQSDKNIAKDVRLMFAQLKENQRNVSSLVLDKARKQQLTQLDFNRERAEFYQAMTDYAHNQDPTLTDQLYQDAVAQLEKLLLHNRNFIFIPEENARQKKKIKTKDKLLIQGEKIKKRVGLDSGGLLSNFSSMRRSAPRSLSSDRPESQISSRLKRFKKKHSH